ncbi:helix-turn-helix transcriptional regulator [Actinoplanes sp. TRM 88003]|uniref:Helix-turn-helix transcriptional regulator n=1 Tax=Paractinoplanes aksuensis TaxID=2939490 RepID=A0ABT1DSB0_9ACTN|nr:helix-turn-helix transcriptional regulator [Actinoplanes aksuensis]MCO8273725.1 helix-turn-helix transcriptional regulator [Actinoplanes aksuensis]
MLTDQEAQIATLAARGLSNKEIAARLFLSPRTVSSHLYRIFPKLHVTRRSQLRDALTHGSGRPISSMATWNSATRPSDEKTVPA